MHQLKPYILAIAIASGLISALFMVRRYRPGLIPGLGQAPPPPQPAGNSALGVNVLPFQQMPGSVPSLVSQLQAAQNVTPRPSVLAPV